MVVFRCSSTLLFSVLRDLPRDSHSQEIALHLSLQILQDGDAAFFLFRIFSINVMMAISLSHFNVTCSPLSSQSATRFGIDGVAFAFIGTAMANVSPYLASCKDEGWNDSYDGSLIASFRLIPTICLCKLLSMARFGCSCALLVPPPSPDAVGTPRATEDVFRCPCASWLDVWLTLLNRGRLPSLSPSFGAAIASSSSSVPGPTERFLFFCSDSIFVITCLCQRWSSATQPLKTRCSLRNLSCPSVPNECPGLTRAHMIPCSRDLGRGVSSPGKPPSRSVDSVLQRSAP